MGRRWRSCAGTPRLAASGAWRQHCGLTVVALDSGRILLSHFTYSFLHQRVSQVGHMVAGRLGSGRADAPRWHSAALQLPNRVTLSTSLAFRLPCDIPLSCFRAFTRPAWAVAGWGADPRACSLRCTSFATRGRLESENWASLCSRMNLKAWRLALIYAALALLWLGAATHPPSKA